MKYRDLNQTLKAWLATLKETALNGNGAEKIMVAMLFEMIEQSRIVAITRIDFVQEMLNAYPHTRGYTATDSDYQNFLSESGGLYKVLFTDQDGVSLVALDNPIIISTIKEKQQRDKIAKPIYN